jgi:hypothetical protein
VVGPDGNGRPPDEGRSRHQRQTASEETEMITYPMTAELAAAHRQALLGDAASARLARDARPAERRSRRGTVKARWHRSLTLRPAHA